MSGIGDKVNGAFRMVQGVGDQIRGSLMETLDTTLAPIANPNPNDQPTTEIPAQKGMSKNAELWNRGKEEYREGRARMSGTAPSTVQTEQQENTFNPSDTQPGPQGVAAPPSGEASESERPPIQPREDGQFGHGDKSVGVVPGGGRVAHPEAS
ncbi:hypothetical protein OE88DRAFT_1667895 [Heliocybe sulcata]|uniref:Uncharacterized protein n=1 Tax=Heliocybe sulcata TaxID=5364 RepID=A0A5C3MLI6_9AGAM|nr:hypothetical protein OE88DRAFT_1667895 [Heliocybe sulcata]